MKEWQKDYVEKHKEKEIKIEGDKIEFGTGRWLTKSSIFLDDKLGILYVSFESKNYIAVENVEIMMSYWERFANEEKYQMIIVDSANVHWKKEQFHSLGYHVIPEHLNEILSKGRFLKQLAKGSQKQITKKFKTVINALKKRKEEETFFVYELDKKISLREITIYYKGYSGVIKTKYEDRYLSFYFENEKYTLKNEEEIKKALDAILEKVKNKMRIKNHFQTPRYFFDKKIEVLSYKKEIENAIFDLLLKKHSWEEIEHYFYHVSKRELEEKMTRYSFPIVHKIMNYYFVIDGSVESFSKKEEALEKYKQLMMEKAANKAEETFAKFFNEA